jgi:hypothetical protein
MGFVSPRFNILRERGVKKVRKRTEIAAEPQHERSLGTISRHF